MNCMKKYLGEGLNLKRHVLVVDLSGSHHHPVPPPSPLGYECSLHLKYTSSLALISGRSSRWV
jgi:hypothetical protein